MYILTVNDKPATLRALYQAERRSEPLEISEEQYNLILAAETHKILIGAYTRISALSGRAGQRASAWNVQFYNLNQRGKND